jgi:hypothetical protein
MIYSLISDFDNTIGDNQTILRCENCYRCSTLDFVVHLKWEPIHKYNVRKKLSSLRGSSSQFVWICNLCSVTLLKEVKVLCWEFIWPSYFWKLIVGNLNSDNFAEIWKWIPQRWRPMWVDILPQELLNPLQQLPSYFDDISIKVERLEANLASLKLVNLRDALNLHPYTSVKCPWGCDEFPEMCHYLPLYAFIEHYLRNKSPTLVLPLSETSIKNTNGQKISSKKLVGN